MKLIHETPEYQATARTGDPKFWKMQILQDGNRVFHRTVSWRQTVTGKLSKELLSEPYEVDAKNVGRANETSPKEQAFLEVDSVVKKQQDKGYRAAGEKVATRPLPMLAQKFSERGHKIQWPAYTQPKYNGMRMLMQGTTAWSRGGKDMIPDVIRHLQFDTQGHIIDGELMLPNNQLLQETMKAAKKYRPGMSDKLLYIVYDIVDSTKTFSERYALLKQLVKNTPSQIRLSPVTMVEDIGDVSSCHRRNVADGFEGTMIRDDSEGYAIGQRANQLQKLKDFQDAEFKIVGVNEGGGSFVGCAIFKCVTPDGVEFDCTPEGTMVHRAALYTKRNQWIGQWLTVRFQELSRDGVPLFPVGVEVRDSKEF